MLQQPRAARIGIVVQARMSSRRLPGKVLMQMSGKTILQHLLEGCRHVDNVDTLCVATSDQASDTPIARHCAELQVDCHRGPLDDVAQRFIDAARARGLDALVRISGDSPLVDPRLTTQLVDRYRATEGCELATNVLGRTYPSGMSVEVVRTETLARAHPRMSDAEREHVTPLFYANPGDYRIASVERDTPLTSVKFAVDTAEDFRRIDALVARLEKPYWDYGLEQLAAMLAAVPDEVAL